MKKIQRKAFCPLDGYPTEQQLELTKQSQPFGDYTLYKVEPIPKTTYYYVAVCKMCNGIMLYSAENEDIEKSFPKAELLWPVLAHLSENVPHAVREYYSKALKFKNNEPDIFANQIRRALEAICSDRDVRANSNLYQRIEELAEAEELPPIVVRMMQALRKACNFGSHDSHINPAYVPTVDMFFRAVMEYVYVIPAELDEFLRQLELAGKAKTQSSMRE